MFLDIYNDLVRLGIKSDFRCKVFKYVKPCAKKYSHKLPPPATLENPEKKIEYIYIYKEQNFVRTFQKLMAFRVLYTKICTYPFSPF